MSSKTISLGPLALVWLMGGSTLMAANKDRILFDFEKPDAVRQWQTVNDGVMGGVSDGRIKINDGKKMEFYGTLSLENNGGFASVRTRVTKLGLKKGDTIVVRLRGDGREYNMNLYTGRRRAAFSYRAKFTTKKDQWIEAPIPVDRFVATAFGRVLRNQPLDPAAVDGVGFLLGDKKAGPFKLEVEWIKVRRSPPPAPE